MTFRRAPLLPLLVLIVLCVGRAEAAAVAPTVSLVRGALQVQTTNGLVFTAFRLRLRLADGTAVSGTLEDAGRENTKDDAGEFERLRFRLKPAQVSEASKRLSAVLE